MKITEIDSQRDLKDKALLGIYYKGKLHQLVGTRESKGNQIRDRSDSGRQGMASFPCLFNLCDKFFFFFQISCTKFLAKY